MHLEKRLLSNFQVGPSLLESCALSLMLLSSNEAYHRPDVMAPWSSDFLSPLVFASLTVSGGFALVRALAGFHLSL